MMSDWEMDISIVTVSLPANTDGSKNLVNRQLLFSPIVYEGARAASSISINSAGSPAVRFNLEFQVREHFTVYILSITQIN